MLIKIKRLDATDHGIFGHLTLDSSKFECVTLERHDIAIPEGNYSVTLYNSPKHGYLVPLLHGIPERDMIEIHPGNRELDSLGCILVGSNRDGFAIDSSRKAFEGLMKELKGYTHIQCQIQ